MARIPWIGQSATAKSSNVDSLRLVNGYAEVVESKQGKAVTAIYGTPGTRVFCTLDSGGPIRGLYKASNDRVFAVQASVLHELFADGTHAPRGAPLQTTVGPVSMADNTLDLALVDGSPGGLYRLHFADNQFYKSQDAPIPAAVRVSFLDNYLLMPEVGSQKFWWTDLFSTTIDDLNFASAEGAPDKLVTQLVIHRELWNFGTQSTEIWYNTGDADSPFARIGGGFIHQGCVAAQSPTRVGETVIWLSANDEGQGMAVQASGYSPNRVSTHAVEEAWSTYSTISDAIGWSQQWQGHQFWWLVFPTARKTWVLDGTSGLWAERCWLNPVTGTFDRHRANCYSFAFGKHLVGDYADGRVYELHDTTYTDDGLALLFQAVLPPLFDANGLGGLLEQPWLQIEAETGVGLDGAVIPGSDPKMMLETSEDGGHRWNPALTRSMGKLGETKAMVEWRRLGSFRDRRCRISVSDPVKRAIVGAVTDVRPLRP